MSRMREISCTSLVAANSSTVTCPVVALGASTVAEPPVRIVIEEIYPGSVDAIPGVLTWITAISIPPSLRDQPAAAAVRLVIRALAGGFFTTQVSSVVSDPPTASIPLPSMISSFLVLRPPR